MGNLTAMIASELSKKMISGGSQDKVFSKQPVAANSGYNVVLQLNSIPFILDPSIYLNAHSNANPTGSYRAAYEFALLSDSIPLLKANYIDSLNSVSKVWGNIVNNANSASQYSQAILKDAQSLYNLSKFSGFSGVPEDWYNIEARPSNWCELLNDDSNLLDLEIDLVEGDSDAGGFLVLDDSINLSWQVLDAGKNNKEFAMNINTKITKIYLSILRVDFYRSWLNFEILNSKTWKIDGLEKGYFSNGSLIDNEGIFPLIPQSILIGSKIKFAGSFDSDDVSFILTCKSLNNIIAIGPFILNNKSQEPLLEKKDNNTMVLTSSVKQAVGYISRLIPESPPLSGF